MMGIQCGVVHALSIECHGVDGRVSIGYGVGFLARGWWYWCMVLSCRMLRIGGNALSGQMARTYLMWTECVWWVVGAAMWHGAWGGEDHVDAR